MEKRRLGQSDLWVAPLGFGGIPIQRVSQTEADQLLRLAVEKGINFIDTARGYTDSEVKIGVGLKGIRQEVLLATKSMARTGAGMTEDVERSLRNFQTDWIDLYQLHNVRTDAEWAELTAPGGGLEALEKAREAGKIRYIGITGHLPHTLARFIKDFSFVSVQFPYNYIEQENRQELLTEIKRQGLGSIIMKPLAGGALRQAGPALRFLLQKSFSVIIPGMDTREQIEDNSAQLSQMFSEQDAKVLEIEKGELGQEFCRRCEYCLPCAAGINIPGVFLLEGYYKRYNLTQWSLERYQGMSIQADACTDCGECETRCPYQLPIREKLKKVHALLSNKK
ncbi:Aldo/keto reductase family protein [Candidatus Desulfosporosinus infrequens]|uniref:Aldo/keto reductase family protein n=1 Tax=Candidatus Desulfosporosinus infrequens TaxID=2043169 RepID=A0A2U3K4V9_9FIRM|nr:Aldo/keto reductase family protein [Candidatus Desulfosporosinus infrequens]